MSDRPFDMPPLSAGFDARGGWVVKRLLTEPDLGFVNPIHPAAIVGNLGGESGLAAINERHPIEPGSLGGWSWAQWTGTRPGGRRAAFNAYAKSRGLPLDSDQAAYEFLVKELLTSENHALVQLKKTTTLEAAVETFEVLFERPSDPAGGLPSRIAFARKALAAASISQPIPPIPTHPTPSEPELAQDPITTILAAPRFQDGVQAFQKANGLIADGVIGRLTLLKISEQMPAPKGEAVDLTLADIIAEMQDSLDALKEYEAQEREAP